MDRHGNFLATHVPERPIYDCRVELPDKTTVSTDVAATLRKEDLPRTVDGLKEALKKKLADELHGITVAQPRSRTPTILSVFLIALFVKPTPVARSICALLVVSCLLPASRRVAPFARSAVTP